MDRPFQEEGAPTNGLNAWLFVLLTTSCQLLRFCSTEREMAETWHGLCSSRSFHTSPHAFLTGFPRIEIRTATLILKSTASEGMDQTGVKAGKFVVNGFKGKSVKSSSSRITGIGESHKVMRVAVPQVLRGT